MRSLCLIILFTFFTQFADATIPDSTVAKADAVITGYVLHNIALDSVSSIKRFSCTIVVWEICNNHSSWFETLTNLIPGDTIRNVEYWSTWKSVKRQDSTFHFVLLRAADSGFTLIHPWYFDRYFTQTVDINYYCDRHLEGKFNSVHQSIFTVDPNGVETENSYRKDSSIVSIEAHWVVDRKSIYEYKKFDSAGRLYTHTKYVNKDKKYGWREFYYIYCRDGKPCNKRSTHRVVLWFMVRMDIRDFFHPRSSGHF